MADTADNDAPRDEACPHDYLTVEADGTHRCCDCWGVMSPGQSTENDALREAAAIGWEAAVAAMKYEDGTPVEVVAMVNPYRVIPPGEQQ